MSVSSINGMTPQSTPYHSQPAAGGAKKSENDGKELTTVTTHCNKNHEHDRTCPHTVSTKPAPKAGEPGYLLDERI